MIMASLSTTFTFDAIADDSGHDVTADMIVANDNGGLV